MKRILLAVTILALFLPAMRQAEARVDVSIDFFYDNIGPDGNWVEVADYGYCWQPSVAVSNSHWRPYSDGYWAYTDVGWTWVSYEEFGWATYHYGRWTRLRDRGWFWVPGREWGPAWVSWRTGGDYVGWAPLPPRNREEVDYDDRPISGQVDVEFDIGPDYYNFVDVRYIGEPVLRERIVQPSLNITYISNTVNVTNITYTNSVVFNHGPDYDRLSRYSTRPIRRMTIERDSNVELSVAAQARGLTRVQGDRLIVAAPLKFQKPPRPIAPKMVKEKITKPTFERGWNGDPKAQADLKQKMKSEDPKNVPPPSIKPRDNAEAAPSPAGASPAPGTTPATVASPVVPANPVASAAPASPAMTPDKVKGRDKSSEDQSPMPTVAPVKPVASPVMTPPGKFNKDRVEKPIPAVSPSSAIAPGANPALTPSRPKERPNTPSSLVTSPDGTPVRDTPIHDQGIKKDKRPEKAPDMMPPTRQPSAPPIEKAPRKLKDESLAVPPTREMPPKPKITSEPMPPTREAPPDAPHMPPKAKITSEPMPPTRQAPPEVPRKQAPVEVPKQRLAPPPAPPANEPPKNEAPPSKRAPDKKTAEPVPSPRS